MSRENVLHGARLAGEPVSVGVAELAPELECGWGFAARREPRVHTARELAAARAAAHAEGLAQGEALGREAERANLAHALRLLAEITQRCSAERATLLHRARRDLMQLALAMAEKLARRSLTLDRGAALRALRDALRHAGRAQLIVVRLHPDDAALLRDSETRSALAVAPATAFEVREDPTVTAGGCLIETPELHIDATLDGLLARFAQALEDWRDTQDDLLLPPMEDRDAA